MHRFLENEVGFDGAQYKSAASAVPSALSDTLSMTDSVELFSQPFDYS